MLPVSSHSHLPGRVLLVTGATLSFALVLFGIISECRGVAILSKSLNYSSIGIGSFFCLILSLAALKSKKKICVLTAPKPQKIDDNLPTVIRNMTFFYFELADLKNVVRVSKSMREVAIKHIQLIGEMINENEPDDFIMIARLIKDPKHLQKFKYVEQLGCHERIRPNMMKDSLIRGTYFERMMMSDRVIMSTLAIKVKKGDFIYTLHYGRSKRPCEWATHFCEQTNEKNSDFPFRIPYPITPFMIAAIINGNSPFGTLCEE